MTASYIMPMPAWKSSYRLLFGRYGTQPTLEGWAIVDNTTGEDWTNVQISLVSGKPISFISQLYAPKYIKRQGAELAEDQAVAPTVYTAARWHGEQVAQHPRQHRRQQLGQAAGAGVNGAYGASIAGDSRAAAASAPAGCPARSPTVGSGAGDRRPLRIPHCESGHGEEDESAMLPFLQQKIAARKLIIYSDPSRANPFNAAEMTNNTGKTLDGGPITVYDAGAYAGEALVETIKSADKRFISYGVDLGTRIATNLDSRHRCRARTARPQRRSDQRRAAVVQKKT